MSPPSSAPASCAAGGDYTDGSFHLQALVASETNGTWRKAIEVPGTRALNRPGGGRGELGVMHPGG